jgi:hypothetical protein
LILVLLFIEAPEERTNVPEEIVVVPEYVSGAFKVTLAPGACMASEPAPEIGPE